MSRRATPIACFVLLTVLAACSRETPPEEQKPPPAPPTAALVPADAPAPGQVEAAPAAPSVPIAPGAAEPLTVVVAIPQGLVEGAVRPSLTFSRPVRPLGAPDDPSPPVELVPAPKGRWRWLGSSTLEFAAEAPFAFSTAYQIRVPAGVRALDGGTLAADYAWSFETPRIQPQSGDPVSSWRAYAWVQPQQVFEVVFSQRPREAALLAKVHVRGAGEAVPLSLVSIETPHERRVRLAKEKGEPPPAPPAASPELGDADRRIYVRLRPSRPLPLASALELVFPAGLESTDGPLPSDKEFAWKFSTYGPLAVAFLGCQRWHAECPDGPLTLQLTNPVKAKDLKAALKIEPAVTLGWPEDEEQTQSEWVFGGDFRPSTAYTVTIAAGLRDEFGQTLAAEHRGAFTTGDFEPSLFAWNDEATLEREHRLALPLQHVNVGAVTVQWARLTPDEIIPWLQNPYRKEAPPGLKTVNLPLSAPRNFRATSPLDLAPLLGEPSAAPGRLGFVRVRWKHGDGSVDQPTVVQATALGVHFKTSPADTRVFVWRLADGAAVGGARVELLDQRAASLAVAETGADGVAALPGVTSLAVPQVSEHGSPLYGPPFLAARVTLGDDVAYATTRDPWALGPYRFDLSSDWEGVPPRAEGLVFTDRGIYRPGETVHVKGILRERSVGKLRTPVGRTVKLELLDPQGERVQEKEGVLSRFGGVATELALPADGRLGDYTVRVTDPTTKLSWAAYARMAEYRPPEFLVDVNVAEATRFDADPVRAVVESRYLFGAAMSGAEVKWAMHARPGSFAPEKSDGFVFGRRYVWWEDDESHEEQLVASGANALDAEGRFTVDAGPADTPDDRPQVYTVEAAVTDVNRQEVAGRTSFDVHPASFYVGLKGPAGFATAGQPFSVQVVSMSPVDEKRVPGASVELKLVRQEWKTIRKRTGSGTFETVSEREAVDAGSCKVATNADLAAPATCTFTAEKSGYHDLLATATDSAGRKTTTTDGVWVTGPGYAAWLQDDDNRVEVVADKATYDVGDTARLLVQSPFPEAEAWVTVEREGVLKQQRLRLRGTATPIEIPIDEAMIPNVFVGVVLVRGRAGAPEQPGDPGRPTFRVGYRELRVVPAVKRLKVELAPDAAEKRPGDDLTVNVAVTDHQGRGAPAEVTVWAVDEGVLSLTGYEAPDPVDSLYQPRGLSVRQSTNLLALVPQLRYGEKGREAGGGGGLGESMTVRKRFQTTPLFVGAVETDAQGKAVVRGKLPDNLTTFRLMAVAVTTDDRGGRGRSKVVVNKPLMARPALPRAARTGDVFAAGIVVHAKPAGAQPGSREVEVSANVEGPVEAMDALTRKLTIPEGKGTEVRFGFKATGNGAAKLRFSVKGGADADAVELTVPVKVPVAPESVAVYGDLEAGGAAAVEAVQTPGGIRPDVGGLTLTLASTALVGLGADAAALIDYPYGCLEQQSSRLVPFVALKSLLDRYGKDWLGERQPGEVVASTLQSIGALQRPDGGFGYWPGDSCPSYWASTYATLALGEAQAAGYAVPPAVLGAARNYVRERLEVAAPCEWGLRRDEERALGAYVLARSGMSPLASMRGLHDRRGGLALFGKALLAHAWTLAEPRGGRAKALMTEIMNAARVSAAEVHFEESDSATYAALFHSDTRTTGLVLQALLAAEPEHPFVPKIARYLLKIRGRGTYRNTQEAGFSLMALADYARIREGDTPDLEATVQLGAVELARQAFRARDLESRQELVPLSKLPASGQQIPLTFAATGRGRLYYGALLRSAPAELPTQPRDAGLVVQRWYEPFGREGRVRSVLEGELVRVRLRVATSQARNYVVVDDPLPSGLEAVDTSLQTTSRLTPLAVDPEGVEGDADSEDLAGAGEPSWYSPFSHVEQRDDRVLLFADRLPPGVHAYSYVARATTAGTFVLPPARAEEMYTPEVSGRSDGGSFWVHPRAEVSMR